MNLKLSGLFSQYSSISENDTSHPLIIWLFEKIGPLLNEFSLPLLPFFRTFLFWTTCCLIFLVWYVLTFVFSLSFSSPLFPKDNYGWKHWLLLEIHCFWFFCNQYTKYNRKQLIFTFTVIGIILSKQLIFPSVIELVMTMLF
jgi:hypothetical protein